MTSAIVETFFFWAFASLTILSSLGVIFARNPIASAMSLVATFFFLAGIYVLLWGHTIAALQVLVYAGAIMVLFLFVIMLLSLSDHGPVMTFSPTRIAGGASVVGLFVALVAVFRQLPETELAWTTDAAKMKDFGSIKHLGEIMYTQWLFPFEAVSLLLLVAILGAVVVAKPRI